MTAIVTLPCRSATFPTVRLRFPVEPTRPASVAMSLRVSSLLVAFTAFLAAGGVIRSDEKTPYSGTSYAAVVDDFFKDEVWGKVGSQVCLTCHKKGGEAEDSKLVLQDPGRAQGAARDEAMRHNRDTFARMARLKNKDQ